MDPVTGQEPGTPDFSQTPPNDIAGSAFFTVQDDIPIPKSYKAAMASEHNQHWIAACQAEIDSLADMETWILQDLPGGSKAIGTKWV